LSGRQLNCHPSHFGPEETLVILREAQDDGTIKHDYYLSNASHETALTEFARVAKAEHRIESAYAYHWNSHNRLPLLRFKQRK